MSLIFTEVVPESISLPVLQHQICNFHIAISSFRVISDRKTRDTPKCCIMYAPLNGRLKLVVIVALLPWLPDKTLQVFNKQSLIFP